MLSKEDLCMIINYCQENGISYKEGYKEFGVTQWAFYTFIYNARMPTEQELRRHRPKPYIQDDVHS